MVIGHYQERQIIISSTSVTINRQSGDEADYERGSFRIY